MEEVPEEVIAEAEATPGAGSHGHDGVTAEDGTLAVHLQEDHSLDAGATLSPATQEGLHDRLHGRTKAADD